jgi:hypothetical protein
MKHTILLQNKYSGLPLNRCKWDSVVGQLIENLVILQLHSSLGETINR